MRNAIEEMDESGKILLGKELNYIGLLYRIYVIIIRLRLDSMLVVEIIHSK